MTALSPPPTTLPLHLTFPHALASADPHRLRRPAGRLVRVELRTPAGPDAAAAAAAAAVEFALPGGLTGADVVLEGPGPGPSGVPGTTAAAGEEATAAAAVVLALNPGATRLILRCGSSVMKPV
jgi:hypothetical protein